MASPDLFSRYVEPGRLALIRYGPLAGKVVTMIDMRRVIVDGPTTGVSRQQIPTKWLSLTSFKCTLQRGAAQKVLKKNLAASGVMEKWAKTSWAKKIAAKEAKASLTDFDRFKLMLAKKKVNQSVRKATKVTKAKK